jgi:hypothetical protein
MLQLLLLKSDESCQHKLIRPLQIQFFTAIQVSLRIETFNCSHYGLTIPKLSKEIAAFD